MIVRLNPPSNEESLLEKFEGNNGPPNANASLQMLGTSRTQVKKSQK